MDEPGSDLVSINVPCDRHAPSAVRQALDHSAQIGWPLGDAVLVASELVTNAVLHSGCSQSDPIEVRVSLRSERVVITVRDPGVSGQDAHVREGTGFGGWGLQIVDQLAERWGSERGDGYRVWAEVALAD